MCVCVPYYQCDSYQIECDRVNNTHENINIYYIRLLFIPDNWRSCGCLSRSADVSWRQCGRAPLRTIPKPIFLIVRMTKHMNNTFLGVFLFNLFHRSQHPTWASQFPSCRPCWRAIGYFFVTHGEAYPATAHRMRRRSSFSPDWFDSIEDVRFIEIGLARSRFDIFIDSRRILSADRLISMTAWPFYWMCPCLRSSGSPTLCPISPV